MLEPPNRAGVAERSDSAEHVLVAIRRHSRSGEERLDAPARVALQHPGEKRRRETADERELAGSDSDRANARDATVTHQYAGHSSPSRRLVYVCRRSDPAFENS